MKYEESHTMKIWREVDHLVTTINQSKGELRRLLIAEHKNLDTKWDLMAHLYWNSDLKPTEILELFGITKGIRRGKKKMRACLAKCSTCHKDLVTYPTRSSPSMGMPECRECRLYAKEKSLEVKA